MTLPKGEAVGRPSRLAQWRPGLLLAAIAILIVGFPALAGAESLREYWGYDPSSVHELQAELNAREAAFGVTLAVAAVVAIWIVGLATALVTAVLGHTSLWRTVLPTALAVPISGTLFIYGGAALAALQAANLTR